MNRSSKAPRRRGRDKGDGGGTLPFSSSSSNGMSSFHAPLIQWTQDASTTWYEYGKELPGRNDSISSSSSSSSTKANTSPPALVRWYRSMADSIYANELRLFKQGQSKKSSSDEHWVENTMRKGTLKDRIAAMSVTLSTDPLHKFYALDGLMGMVGCSTSADGSGGGKPNSRVAQLTAEALEDLFINTLLPPNRKLLTLAHRPLYQYEDNEGNKDSIDADDGSGNKKKKKKKSSSDGKKALSPRILLLWRFEEMIKEKYDLYLRQYMAQTLQDGVELQKIATLRSAGNLLSSIPEGEIQLLNMMVNKLGDPEKKTAAAAGHQVRIILQQHPNMQTVAAREVQQLAHRPQLAPKALYNCIVFLNQLQLKRPTETTTFSLSASLIKTYFRLFEVAVKQDNKKRKKSSDDTSGTMKSRLLSALLTGVNRAHPYLPEKDRDMEEHVDALYRIVHTTPPGACTQALMLLFHLAVGSQLDDDKEDEKKGEEKMSPEKKRQKDRFYRALYATLSKGNMVSNGKHLTMYFNVLYKAMKYDTDMNRVHVFSKRLLTAVMHAPSPSIAASMYLLQEISKSHEGLRQSWEDIPDPETDSWLVLDDTKREPKAGLINIKDTENSHHQKKDYNHSDLVSYHSQGNPPCWEISLLAHHFHPSVSKFVNDIGEINYKGDPLQDFCLAPFLDKFAYRNPKSREKLIQHHQQSGKGTGSRRNGKLQAQLELPLNDPSFLDRTDVNEQDEFFHRFFVERARRDKLKGVKRNSSNAIDIEDSDDEVVRDEVREKAIDAAEESGGLDGEDKAFEDYETMWESDDEEEAFVDSLAMQLMENAADGPVDIDDDSEGTNDLDDLYADESDHNEEMKTEEDEANETDGSDGSDDEDEEHNESVNKKNQDIVQDNDDDEDAFMEDADSDSDSQNDNSHNEPNFDEEKIIGGMGVEAFGDDKELDEDNSDDEDDLGMFLAEDESEAEDVEANTVVDRNPKKRRKKSKNDYSSPIFADADEYEEMIEKSLTELKRAATTQKVHVESTASNKKPKNRKKERKRS